MKKQEEEIKETIMLISYLLNHAIRYLQRIAHNILTVDKPYNKMTDLQRYHIRRMLAKDVPFEIAWKDMRKRYLEPALRMIDKDLSARKLIFRQLRRRTYRNRDLSLMLTGAEKCKRKKKN